MFNFAKNKKTKLNLLKMKKEYITFDVMLEDRFVCTMRMPHPSIMILDPEEARQFIISKRPSLRNKNFRIALV